MFYFKFIIFLGLTIAAVFGKGEIPKLTKSNHTNNWAVFVNSSPFWFNYRHASNVLAMYQTVKRLGIPDSQIILMLADDIACNRRNSRPGTVYAKQYRNVYGNDVVVDYRGYDVSVENFIRLLTGRLTPGKPRSKKLLTDEGSNILLYIAGHGGDGFFKFQDYEEISNQELADALAQMWQIRRYNEILLILDTCHAITMCEKLYSPNILCVSSSLEGEDSHSEHVDFNLGVHTIDRFSYRVFKFLDKIQLTSSKTIQDLIKVCPKSECISTVGTRTDLFRRDLDTVLVTDFFGSNTQFVEVLNNSYLNITFDVKADENNRKNKKIDKDNVVHYNYVEQFPSYLFNP